MHKEWCGKACSDCKKSWYVRAASPKEAREMVCDMTTSKMYEKSDGTWDIDEAEEQEDT